MNLRELLSYLRIQRNFNPEIWLKNKIDKLETYLSTNKLNTCIISVSGGIDSSTVFAICKYASNQYNSNIKKIVALAQPIESTASIWKRVFELEKVFNHPVITIEQTQYYNNLINMITNNINIEPNQFVKGQLKSYMRTPINYYIAQLYSSIGYSSIVMGTGNYDEDGYLYYFCKAGDGVVDLQIISDLHKSEVYEVAKLLNVPQSIINAKPSADLWDGQTDEDEMGITYDFIELYTELLKLDDNERTRLINMLDINSITEFKRYEAIAIHIHNKNKHKSHFPVNI
jgi:NAD+ synthase (glutamine-hydrolysing)